VSFDRASQEGLAERPRVRAAVRGVSTDPVLALQHAIGNRAVARLLQRVPATRVTQYRTAFGNRITGRSPAEKLEKFATLRARATGDARTIVNDLEWNHLWGTSKSDVTLTGEEYSIRIDRQNPTPTHSNIQIQTNGESVSLATVLVPDSLFRAPSTTQAAIVTAVRAAFLSSLADGMQWEVYDDAPQTTTVTPQVPRGKDKGGGKGGGKWNDTRKNPGGPGGGNPTVGVQ
jgi:hypothetical protein